MLVTCLLYNALRSLLDACCYMLITCVDHLWQLNNFFLSKTGASSSKALTLETSNGGRIWNLSAMTGWLASKCLSSPVPVKDVVKFDHCVCQAVVIQVHGISGRHAVRVHMSCHREVESNSGNFFCKKCKVTHLNEMLNKPTQLVSLNPLNSNISVHLLCTVVYTFPFVLTRRICSTIKASQVGDHFFYTCNFNVWFKSDILRRN